jgi:hypothetical protein
MAVESGGFDAFSQLSSIFVGVEIGNIILHQLGPCVQSLVFQVLDFYLGILPRQMIQLDMPRVPNVAHDELTYLAAIFGRVGQQDGIWVMKIEVSVSPLVGNIITVEVECGARMATFTKTRTHVADVQVCRAVFF